MSHTYTRLQKSHGAHPADMDGAATPNCSTCGAIVMHNVRYSHTWIPRSWADLKLYVPGRWIVTPGSQKRDPGHPAPGYGPAPGDP